MNNLPSSTGKTYPSEPPIPQADGQAAVEFPVRSGDEVSLGFTTREELPR
jgi:hypothetical protein